MRTPCCKSTCSKADMRCVFLSRLSLSPLFSLSLSLSLSPSLSLSLSLSLECVRHPCIQAVELLLRLCCQHVFYLRANINTTKPSHTHTHTHTHDTGTNKSRYLCSGKTAIKEIINHNANFLSHIQYFFALFFFCCCCLTSSLDTSSACLSYTCKNASCCKK